MQLTWSDYFKRISANIAVFIVLIAACGSFFFNQYITQNEKYFNVYKSWDSRVFYNYQQVFEFKFKDGFQPELAYDRYNNVSIIAELSRLTATLQNDTSICKRVFESITEADIIALNAGKEVPQYFSNERSCVAPYSFKTREYTITASTSVPVSFDLAEKIASVVKTEIESAVDKMDGNPSVSAVVNSEMITKADRSTLHPQGFSEAVQYCAITVVLATSLTLIFAQFANYLKRKRKYQKNAKNNKNLPSHGSNLKGV